MSIFERLTCLFAPDDCLICSQEGALLCAACLPTLPVVPGRCFGCHAATGGVVCARCLQTAMLTSVAGVTHYKDASQHLVGSLKFSGNQAAARIMAQTMLPLLPPGGILTNMPATTAHVRERGFDQSALIAKHLSRLSGLPYKNVLRRHGQQHQLGADRAGRLRQLSGALFVSRPATVTGEHIILVDDVLTTGSSLTAATRVLRAAGAAKVSAVVFAQSIK